MIFIGIDNGRKGHRWAVVDETQRRLKGGEIPNESWAFMAWCDHIEGVYPGQDIVVGIEAGGGLSSPFDRVMQERGWSVRQLSGEAVRTYRETVLRIHNKTDDTDAFTLARMLASGEAPSQALNEERAALRRATRWRQSLVDHKTVLFNELRAALALYWPETTTSDVFAELDQVWTLALLAEYPDPTNIAALGPKRLLKFLHKANSTVGLEKVQAVVELARKNRCFAEDKSFLVRQVAHAARLLRELERSKADTEAAIRDLAQHDAEVKAIDALYGVSTVQAAGFMAEARSLDRFESEAHLASYAGQALKRLQTGKSLNLQRHQWRANRRLKRCVLGMAETLAMNEPRSKAYYRKKRDEGKMHRQALRALARHLIRRLFRLLRSVRQRLLDEAVPPPISGP